ncbi:MAG: MBL fold metallo-hydrolase [Chloroflexi bacterium]|nr:MBL fold metallo-hydrolase [Chloroflexota bacterium]
MILDCLVVGPLSVNCYLVGDERTRQGIVIDPGDDARKIIDGIKRHQLQIVAIVNTHAHFDHVGAVEAVRKFTGAPFLLHAEEAPVLEYAASSAAAFGLEVAQPQPADRLLRQGDEVSAGAVELNVIETPGHTPGGICLYTAGVLFAGDTLFRGGIGRVDLPGGDYAVLMRSIGDRLLALPDSTKVYPGHGPATTISEERRLNPFLKPLMTGRWQV